MANYYGGARTNYVRVSDMDGLVEFLEDWPIKIDNRDGKVAFFSIDEDSGGWPSWRLNDEGEDIEFDFGELMMFVEPGEVLVLMETGAEKLRYLVGYAAAYIRTGGEVKHCSVNIDEIYKRASEKFDVDVSKIDNF